jgi:enoyl-CoA hydratase/carnithine racemase
VDFVSCEKEGQVLLVTLRRPDRLNAMGYQLLCELADAFTAFAADRSLRVAILTGTGRGFSVGLDMKDRFPDATGPLVRPDISPHVNPFWPDNTLDKPVVTAVNGFAFGGGFYLAVTGDLCVAAESASFEISEVHRGGLSGWEVGYLLSLPRALRSEIALGGRLSARRAYDVGIVNDLVPDDRLLERAMERAQQLTAVAPVVVRRNLELLRDLAPVVPGHVQRLREAYEAEVASSADAREAVLSFAEKRPPIWQDE